MGKLIELTDQDYQYCQDYASGKTNTMALNNISRIIKAVADGTQYEAHLKADLIDILLDVQNEIKQKELEAWGYPNIEYSRGLKLTVDIIQKKIRALKENEDGENKN